MSVIIRLQNLPWSANAGDVRTFFKGLLIPDGGVHIVGGEQGDAFIAFGSDEDARLAMRKTGEILKGIQITLYLSSRSEMQKVIEEARQQAISQQYAAKPTPQVQSPAQSAPVQPQAPPPPIINNVATNIAPPQSNNLPSASAPFLAPPYFQQNDKFSTEGGSIGSGGYDWYKQQRMQSQTAVPAQSNDPRVNTDPRRQPQPAVQQPQPTDYPNQYNYQQPPVKSPFGQTPYMMTQQPPRQHETNSEVKHAGAPGSMPVKPDEKKDLSNRHSSTADKKDSKSSSSTDRRDRERDRSTRRRRSRSRSRDHDRRSSRHHRSRSRDRSSRRNSRRSRSRSKDRARDGGRSDRSRTRGSSREKNDRRPQDAFMTSPNARHQPPQSTSAEALSMFSQQNVRNTGDTLPGLGEIPNDMPKILSNILGTPAHQREMITSDMHDSIKESDGARQGEIWPGALRNEKNLPDRWGNDGVTLLPPPDNKPFIPDGPGHALEDQRRREGDGPNGRLDKPNWQNQQREHNEIERPGFGKEEEQFEDQRENPVGQFDPRVGRGRFDGPSVRGMPGSRFEGPNGRGAPPPPFGRGERQFDGPVGRGMMFENRGMRLDGPGSRGGRFERPFGRGEPPFDAANGGPETFMDKPPYSGPPPSRFDGKRGRGGRFGGPPFEDGFNNEGGFPIRGRGGRGAGMRRFEGEFEDGGMSGPPPAEIFRGGRGGMFRGRGRGGFLNSGGGSPADSNSPRHSTETCSVEILNIPLISRYRDIRMLFEGLFIPPDAIKVLGDEKGTRIGVALLRFSNPNDAFEATKFSGRYIYDNQVQIRLIDEEIYDKHPDVWVTREKNKAERHDAYHEEHSAHMQLVPSDWVHVMGLNPSRSEDDVYKIFEQNNVKDIVREFDRVSKQPTGGFFARFSCPEEAADVCCNFNSQRYEGDILNLVHVMPNIVRNNAPIELQRKDHANLRPTNNVGQKRPIEVEAHPDQSPPKVKKELLTDSVMLTNLSFDASERDIHDFFSHTGLLPEKIHLLTPRDGRAKKAYVVFTEIQNAKDALQRNGQMLRQLPLNIELVAKPEVMNALGLTFNPLELIKKTNSFNQMKPEAVDPSNGGPNVSPPAAQSEVIVEQFGRPGCVVALSNVHFNATTDDIIAFLSAEFPSVIPENVIRRYDEKGMATSDARVALPSPDAARRAIAILNNKLILGNPVQVMLV